MHGGKCGFVVEHAAQNFLYYFFSVFVCIFQHL
ncbi:MAG: hypothetical protein HYT37_01535 [Candidatus Sungbacteria bacterium]|nr:hypothetical protein [Candidatus Sungbacteria bacterium]